MDATSLSVLTNPYLVLGYPTSLLLDDVVCRLLPVASCKRLSFQPKNSTIRSYVSNRGGGLSVLGRAYKQDDFSAHTSSVSKSSNSEKLIALFRRIQMQISQGESESGNYSQSSQAFIDDDSPIETSVLEFLQQSKRETKAEGLKSKRNEESNRKRKTSIKEISTDIPEPSTTKNFTRPPSNFVKKSPIPSSSALCSNGFELNNKEESSSQAGKGSLKVEGMKLSELKELAKARGIRGYSKLKKSELLELLKSQMKKSDSIRVDLSYKFERLRLRLRRSVTEVRALIASIVC